MFDGMCTEYTEYTGYTEYTDYAELYLHCTVPAVAVARFLPNTELPVNGLVAAWRWWREKTGRQRGAVECCAETADNTDIDVDISTQNIGKRPLLVERVYTCLSI